MSVNRPLGVSTSLLAWRPMIQTLAEWLNLTPDGALLAVVGVFVASLVRGFSGFALTAVVMVSLVIILPPIELIPICLVLEGVAGLFMLRSGLREANIPLVLSLTLGSLIGLPIGLMITTTVAPDLSRLVAQLLVLTLAVAQLMQLRPTWLMGKPGRYGAGLMAGIATGLAGLGGMVIALFVLAQRAPPREIRGSLVIYLFVGLLFGGLYQLWFGVMTSEAFSRGLILAPVAAFGVLLGKQLFRPSLESSYRKICLSLLIVLAMAGLAKMTIIG